MTTLKKITRATVLALVLFGALAGAVGITHSPAITLADSGGQNLDAG